jgi:transcriptional regulator with XRE-family HTH domain
MTEELLLLVGSRIREKRVQKKITPGQLAERAGVSKGLISQVENNRTVPSLPVLFNIIHSLQEDIKTFFTDLQDGRQGEKVIIVRKGQETKFQKEPVKGLSYFRILTKSLSVQAIDLALVSLKPGANRKVMIKTEVYEFKHLLKGQIEYQVEEQRFTLQQGDSFFFDGRLKHRLKNAGKEEALLLVVYFF